MADCMTFPATFEEFAEEYKMVDSKEVYSNGIEYIPIFRVKQWLEHQEALKHGYDTGECNIFKCSVCGYGLDDIYEADEKNYPVWNFNYCPHCGAKMDGGNRNG